MLFRSALVSTGPIDTKAVTGPVDTKAVAATGPVDSKAIAANGDLTAQQKQEADLRAQQQLDAQQKAELKAKTGDQTVTDQSKTVLDASDHSQTKIDARSSKPVDVAAPHRAFLVPPSVMAQCVKFEAEEKPSWGFGIQWDYNKSVGLQYAGGTKSVSLTDLECLTAVHRHAARMQNLQFQHETNMQAKRDGIELDKIVYATGGRQGQMVVLQKHYAEQIKTIVENGSDMQKFFNLGAPAAAEKPATVAPKQASKARKAPVVVANCAKEEAALKACRAKLPAPGEK